MKRIVIIFLIYCAGAIAQDQHVSTEALLAHSDSLTGAPLQVAVRAIGTALIGVGDSVQVAVPYAASTDLVFLSYTAAKSATGDIATALTWRCVAEGALTLYGDEAKTVQYMVIR